MTIMYVDLEGGNDANDGLSFANRKQSLNAAAIAVGNGAHEIRVKRSPAPTSMGQTATWTEGSETVTLSSSVTMTVDTCDSAWTASANVTATASTSSLREGTASANLVIASGFTTGLVAYRATGALDLSAYEQISLLIRANGAVTAGMYELRLCSDTAGVTAVHTMSIPALESSVWTPLVFDFATALASSIQSIALYAITDPGSRTINIDNVIACKAASASDCLTHLSLIAPSSGDDDPWYAVWSISGTTLTLASGDWSTSLKSSAGKCFFGGATGDATAYVRRPIFASGGGLPINFGGTSGEARMVISGGWDDTDMSTQPSATWVASNSSSSTVISGGGLVSITFDRICFSHSRGAGGAGAFGPSQHGDVLVTRMSAAACDIVVRNHSMTRSLVLKDCKAFTGSDSIVECISSCAGMLSVEAEKVFASNKFQSSVVNDASSHGVAVRLKCAQLRFATYALRGESSGSITEAWVYDSDLDVGTFPLGINGGSTAHFDNCYFNGIPPQTGVSGVVTVTNAEGVAGAHTTYLGVHTGHSSVVTATDRRHTESDFSWKFNFGTNYLSPYSPAEFKVANVACNAGEARTVRLWMYRNNAAISGRLRVKENSFNGIADTAYSDMAGSADTWEQVSVTFTPTVDCIVEVYAQGWTSNTTYKLWIDDFSVE